MKLKLAVKNETFQYDGFVEAVTIGVWARLGRNNLH
jgi:hypothetical protein